MFTTLTEGIASSVRHPESMFLKLLSETAITFPHIYLITVSEDTTKLY